MALKIHKKVHSVNITYYYFTKNKNKCLMIEYDKTQDYGEFSTSGTWISRLIIHYKNAWVVKELIEISISDVPKSIQDILSYLS